MYDVIEPVYIRDGYLNAGKRKLPNYRVKWDVVGKADSIEDAKEKGFKHPILDVALHKEDYETEMAIAQALAQLY